MRLLLERLRRDDTTIKRINTDDIDTDFAFTNSAALELGQALVGNTHVVEYHIDLGTLTEAHDDEEEEITLNCLNPLLRAIQENPNIEKLVFVMQPASPQLARLFLLAASNNRNVRQVSLFRMSSLDAEAFELLLQRNATIRLEHLQICESLDDGGYDRLAEALSNNTTLRFLDLIESPSSLECFLRHICRHPRLEHLRVQCPSISTTSSSYSVALRHVRNLPPNLVHLEVHGFEFKGNGGDNNFRFIYDGLCNNRTTDMLTIGSCCSFNQEATMLLERMIQPSGSGSAIRSLTISDGNRFAYIIGRIFENVFRDCSAHPENAQLEELVLNDRQEGQQYGLKEFFRSLGENAASVRLRALRVSYADRAGFRSLACCLSKLVHLQMLQVFYLADNADRFRRDFLNGLRMNGSLRQVDVMLRGQRRNDSAQRPFFSTNDSNKIRLYCLRNALLPGAMCKPPPVKSSTAETATGNWTPVQVYPKPFQRALECRAVGVTWSFAALLLLEDSVGGIQSSNECQLKTEDPKLGN